MKNCGTCKHYSSAPNTRPCLRHFDVKPQYPECWEKKKMEVHG